MAYLEHFLWSHNRGNSLFSLGFGENLSLGEIPLLTGIFKHNPFRQGEKAKSWMLDLPRNIGMKRKFQVLPFAGAPDSRGHKMPRNFWRKNF